MIILHSHIDSDNAEMPLIRLTIAFDLTMNDALVHLGHVGAQLVWSDEHDLAVEVTVRAADVHQAEHYLADRLALVAL